MDQQLISLINKVRTVLLWQPLLACPRWKLTDHAQLQDVFSSIGVNNNIVRICALSRDALLTVLHRRICRKSPSSVRRAVENPPYSRSVRVLSVAC